MTEPTKEMVDLWFTEWFESTDSFPPPPGEFVARRAAAWAREQALEEAADEADHWIGIEKSASDACDEIAAAIRALKGKS